MPRAHSGKEDIRISDADRKEFQDAYRYSRKLKKSLLKRAHEGDLEATAILQSKFGVTIHRKGEK